VNQVLEVTFASHTIGELAAKRVFALDLALSVSTSRLPDAGYKLTVCYAGPFPLAVTTQILNAIGNC
jgi:hypothetical protein